MKLLTTTLLAFAVLCSAGCGDDASYSGPTGTLTGKITLNGAVPPDGTVMVLIHKDSGAGATAKIQTDGTYTLTNVRAGLYQVGLANPKADAAVAMDPDAAMKAIEDGSYKEPPASFPAALADPSSSGVTLTVPEGSGSYDLQI